MKAILLLVASLLIATNGVCADQVPNLDDPKVREKILKEAVLLENIEERGSDGEALFYQVGKQIPYTGWMKAIHDNGTKKLETTFKDGKPEGLRTAWDENGKVVKRTRYKDGVEVEE